MSTSNQWLPSPATDGITVDITFTGTDKEKVQQLIDLVSAEVRNPNEPRNMLDGMLPATRDHLAAVLVALKAAVT